MKKISIILCLAFFGACADGKLSDVPQIPGEPQPGESAPPTELSTQVQIDKDLMTLNPDALEKPFLLEASIIGNHAFDLYAPTSEGLQSQIVTFQRQGQSIFLMRSIEGQVVTQELPEQQILAEFPIMASEESTPENQSLPLQIDFNKGMSKIFVNSSLYWDDPNGGLPPQSALSIDHSYIDSADNNGQRVAIRQIVQIYDATSQVNNSYEIRYYLKPYQANSAYKPLRNPGRARVGLFSISPTVKADYGYTTEYAMLWDISTPIPFYFSANTPPEFQEAVQEGVLYWNSAFGRNVVTIEKAPEGVTAPNPDYNVVQWYTNHEAPYAYADLQVDPLTGQILHAQIFIPSFNQRVMQSLLPRLLRQEGIEQKERNELFEETSESPVARLGLAGMHSKRLCELDLSGAVGEMDDTLSNEHLLQVTQDVIRNLVAHEVGHTLGLAHNFAGNLGSEMSPAEKHAAFKKYLQKGTLPEEVKPVISSVMEYPEFEDDVLTGALMKNGDKAMSYDRSVIQWAYLSKSEQPPETMPLFCTHDHLKDFDDCRMNDGGAHPLEYWQYQLDHQIDLLPSRLAENFLFFKTHYNPAVRKPITDVTPDADGVALNTIIPLFRLTHWLGANSRSFRVEDNKMNAWLGTEIARAGGLEKLLSFLKEHNLSERLANAFRKFSFYVEQPGYRKGLRWDGEPYEISDEEIAYMEKVAPRFFNEVENRIVDYATWIVTADNKRLGQLRNLAEKDKLEKILAEWAGFVILSRDEKDNSRFPQQTRLLATQTLDSRLGPVIDWEMENRFAIAEELAKATEEKLGQPLDKLDLESLPRETRQWLMGELEILNALK